MVQYMVLCHVGREYLVAPAVFVDCIESHHGLMDLGTVHHAAPGKYYSSFHLIIIQCWGNKVKKIPGIFLMMVVFMPGRMPSESRK
jgi:hypothetical protein